MQDIVKDTLAFDFISEKEVTNEKSLKDKLIDNILLFFQAPGKRLLKVDYTLIYVSDIKIIE